MKKVNEDLTLPIISRINTFLVDTNPTAPITQSYSCVVIDRENGITQLQITGIERPMGVEFLHLNVDEMGGIYEPGTIGSVKRITTIHGSYLFKFKRGGISKILGESYTPQQMKEVLFRFKAKHPDVEGLDIRSMDKILSGRMSLPSTFKSTTKTINNSPGSKFDNTEIENWIRKAEQFAGDIMYELTGGDHSKMDNLSMGDLEMVYRECLYQVNAPKKYRDKIIKYWMKGYR